MSEPVRIGEYECLGELGQGAAGTVHLCRPLQTKKFLRAGDLVAIKQYKDWVLDHPKQLERIKREFRAGSTIAHPGLVRIYDCVADRNGRPYLVMEYIDGMRLDKWTEMHFPLSERLLVHVLARLADALVQLHGAGTIHRDLKPENIMMSSSFNPIIMDFGVVQVGNDSGGTPSEEFLGTIRNASPELLVGDEVDEKTDLYSFGTVLYCMLHGHQLFHEESQKTRLSNLVQRHEPQFASEGQDNSDVKRQLIELGKNLLQKRPDDRVQSAECLAARLQEIESAMGHGGVEPMHGYVATALTGLSENEQTQVSNVTDTLVSICKDFEIYAYQPRKATDPKSHPDVPPEAVYRKDRGRVCSADVLLVYADPPSFGVGQELEIAASSGCPTIILRPSSRSLSRMVTGSFTNIIGNIAYGSFEDLDRLLRDCLDKNLDRIRSWRRLRKSNLPADLGIRFRSCREAANLSIEEAADSVGISERFLRTIEDSDTAFHNVGVEVIGRLCKSYGTTVAGLFQGIGATRAPTREDPNIRNLEAAATTLNWSAADFLVLRDDYRNELAASGSRPTRSINDWQKEHATMEERRLLDVAPSLSAAKSQRSLFEGQ